MRNEFRVNVLPVCTLAVFVLAFFSCNNDRIKREIKDFSSCDVVVPEDRMLEMRCSIVTDSLDAYPLVVVDFKEMKSCSSCVAAEIAGSERKALSEDHCGTFGVLHIISANAEDSARIYRDLCRERVRGVVLLDTCNAFLSANPQFPSSPLLHTFVMDRHGKVLLVGNPFSVEKMKSMFDKIVEGHRNVVSQQVE